MAVMGKQVRCNLCLVATSPCTDFWKDFLRADGWIELGQHKTLHLCPKCVPVVRNALGQPMELPP
jgi:hypothetical protein